MINKNKYVFKGNSCNGEFDQVINIKHKIDVIKRTFNIF